MGEGRWNDLPRDVRETLRPYLVELSGLCGSNLESLILYGSAVRGEYLPGRSNLNLLLVLATIDTGSLAGLAKVQRRWRKEGIVVPLLVTRQNLRVWQDVFPLEYFELARCRLVLQGSDPIEEVTPDPRLLSAACLQEIRGNLLRVRQRFVEAGGSPEAIAVLVPLSITSLLAALRGLAHLLGRPETGSSEALIADCGANFGVDATTLGDAWRMKAGTISPGKAELPRLFNRYLAAVEQLAEQAAKLTAGRSEIGG